MVNQLSSTSGFWLVVRTNLQSTACKSKFHEEGISSPWGKREETSEGRHPALHSEPKVPVAVCISRWRVLSVFPSCFEEEKCQKAGAVQTSVSKWGTFQFLKVFSF